LLGRDNIAEDVGIFTLDSQRVTGC
jgi:hypothetical protein